MLFAYNKTYIFAQGEDILNFKGSIVGDIGAYDGHFIITAGDAVIRYMAVKTGWFATFVKQPENCYIEFGDPNTETDDIDNFVPVVTLDFRVDAIKIESVLPGGKINYIEYLVRFDAEFSRNQKLIIEQMKALILKDGEPLINHTTTTNICGFVYFNVQK